MPLASGISPHTAVASPSLIVTTSPSTEKVSSSPCIVVGRALGGEVLARERLALDDVVAEHLGEHLGIGRQRRPVARA